MHVSTFVSKTMYGSLHQVQSTDQVMVDRDEKTKRNTKKKTHQLSKTHESLGAPNIEKCRLSGPFGRIWLDEFGCTRKIREYLNPSHSQEYMLCALQYVCSIYNLFRDMGFSPREEGRGNGDGCRGAQACCCSEFGGVDVFITLLRTIIVLLSSFQRL